MRLAANVPNTVAYICKSASCIRLLQPLILCFKGCSSTTVLPAKKVSKCRGPRGSCNSCLLSDAASRFCCDKHQPGKVGLLCADFRFHVRSSARSHYQRTALYCSSCQLYTRNQLDYMTLARIRKLFGLSVSSPRAGTAHLKRNLRQSVVPAAASACVLALIPVVICESPEAL